ncbi:hypothetical protein THASP1DRAFT_24888 [Thamnocephalis sphaerospora]|uniref:Uncharacterized protein n=1 Tax=Thamnocephalis sphaerospora TaxID=78915 RepID=A0A4P9XLZ2_9FUNG|nr:hypothetical protein THASP1DRAFT_24888 [Thamnocephalis sphaerospora]|eukprot:RKP06865.1 hypothetical protein THASP1DRAFT_24888 [Thamnocephalis sphaerospora]
MANQSCSFDHPIICKNIACARAELIFGLFIKGRLPTPIKMYFDIERSFDDDVVTDERASTLATYIYLFLTRYLKMAFGEELDPKIIVMSACSANKFSLHIDPAKVDARNASLALRQDEIRQRARTMSNDVPQEKPCNYSLQDDDEYVFNEAGHKVIARKLAEHEVVHCPTCDIKDGQPFGVPSAKVFASRSGGCGIYCFNCQHLTWLLNTADQHGFVPKDASEVIDPTHEKLNMNGNVDVDFTAPARMIVVDAPMGTAQVTKSQTRLLKMETLMDKVLAVVAADIAA